jgi:hypothetical protein
MKLRNTDHRSRSPESPVTMPESAVTFAGICSEGRHKEGKSHREEKDRSDQGA